MVGLRSILFSEPLVMLGFVFVCLFVVVFGFFVFVLACSTL